MTETRDTRKSFSMTKERDAYKAAYLRELAAKQRLEENLRTIRELLGIRECRGDCCCDDD